MRAHEAAADGAELLLQPLVEEAQAAAAARRQAAAAGACHQTRTHAERASRRPRPLQKQTSARTQLRAQAVGGRHVVLVPALVQRVALEQLARACVGGGTARWRAAGGQRGEQHDSRRQGTPPASTRACARAQRLLRCRPAAPTRPAVPHRHSRPASRGRAPALGLPAQRLELRLGAPPTPPSPRQSCHTSWRPATAKQPTLELLAQRLELGLDAGRGEAARRLAQQARDQVLGLALPAEWHRIDAMHKWVGGGSPRAWRPGASSGNRTRMPRPQQPFADLINANLEASSACTHLCSTPPHKHTGLQHHAAAQAPARRTSWRPARAQSCRPAAPCRAGGSRG